MARRRPRGVIAAVAVVVGSLAFLVGFVEELEPEPAEAIAAQTRWLDGFVAVWSGLMLAVARLAF